MKICTCYNSVYTMLTPRYSKIHPFQSEHSRTGYIGWLLSLVRIVYRVVYFDAVISFSWERILWKLVISVMLKNVFIVPCNRRFVKIIVEKSLQASVPQLFSSPELCGLCLSNENCQQRTGYVLVPQSKNWDLLFWVRFYHI